MMAAKLPTMKMPEFLVFARIFAIGFVGAEVFRLTFYIGTRFAEHLNHIPVGMRVIGILLGLALCAIYSTQRNAHLVATRIGESWRIDLLATLVIGAWSNELASPWLATVHVAFKAADPHWALLVLMLLCAVLASPLVQHHWPRPKKRAPQLHFIADEEILEEKDDLLASKSQARSFAETVLASGAHQGLVFGVDGPWGVGKTSFVNLAERHWNRAADQVIVCRFEPLRYASEPDIAERMIRDLSAAIQSKVFVPEFRPAATRYSRLLKGKADVSFLGFKLSLEPSQETIDELLEDIDEVLRRIDRRVIIVVDDLDRLDPKTVNSVLFATRRTFKLSRATYVLCYDSELLFASKADGPGSREFLEKFVAVKLSLFVDSSNLRDFLRRDWERIEGHLGSVPSDTMFKLGALLNELADILDGNLAAYYLPVIGDLRKVKRFVNAMLLMQMEKTNLGRTDFNRRDLINLMLLHLNYPWVFRRIYAEETEGRSGTFCLKRTSGGPKFENAKAFGLLSGELPAPAWFLLSQLFDAGVLGLDTGGSVDEAELRSRACFNSADFRNLEGYLKLIVRFATPDPQETFALYQDAVEKVRRGTSIASVLASPDFELTLGERAHDRFWRALVSHSHDFNRELAESTLQALIEDLPRYSAFENHDRGLRQRSIYSLLLLLDRAGWGRTAGRRLPNSAENVVEIAYRMFGENAYSGHGLLERLSSPDRGVLGWNDLMLFRLQCSADRQNQLHNVHTALIVDQEPGAGTSGLVSQLALKGMRKLSQQVFALFKRTYILPKRNFFAEVNAAPVADFLGVAFANLAAEASQDPDLGLPSDAIAVRVATSRDVVKSFVIYQLSNARPPNGSGVGCGYYDEEGSEDGGGIAKVMNDYVFDVCFNPRIHKSNAQLFLDHCLSHLSGSYFSGREEDGYIPTKDQLPGGLDPIKMGRFWREHRDLVRGLDLHASGRRVFTSNYVAYYRDDLDGVFAVLDDLADASPPTSAKAAA